MTVPRWLMAAGILLATATPCLANDSIGALALGQSAEYRPPVTSIRERAFAGIIRQQHDFSCGAAVFATLFRDGYGAPIDENDVLHGMLNIADPQIVRERGFSLLDLKNYAKVVGLNADGYQLSLDALSDVRVPMIVLLDVRGYHHFAILRHADRAFAYLADPALGYQTLKLADFAKEWNGIVLIVLGQGYRYDNVLSNVHPPLSPDDLLARAPMGPTPQSEAVFGFTGTPPVQRL